MITESKLFSWHYGKMVRFLGSAFSAGGARFGKKGIRIDYADRKIILSPILPSPGMSELVMSASPLDEMLSSVLITLRERGQYVREVFNDPDTPEPESTLSRQRIEVTMAGGRIHEMALSLVDSGQPLILEFTPAMTRTMPRTLSVLKTALTRAYMEANADSELLIAWSRVNDPAQGEVPGGADAHPWATPAPRPDTQEGEAAQ